MRPHEPVLDPLMESCEDDVLDFRHVLQFAFRAKDARQMRVEHEARVQVHAYVRLCDLDGQCPGEALDAQTHGSVEGAEAVVRHMQPQAGIDAKREGVDVLDVDFDRPRAPDAGVRAARVPAADVNVRHGQWIEDVHRAALQRLIQDPLKHESRGGLLGRG